MIEKSAYAVLELTQMCEQHMEHLHFHEQGIPLPQLLILCMGSIDPRWKYLNIKKRNNKINHKKKNNRMNEKMKYLKIKKKE